MNSKLRQSHDKLMYIKANNSNLNHLSLVATVTGCIQAFKLRNKDLQCSITKDCLHLDLLSVLGINKQG